MAVKVRNRGELLEPTHEISYCRVIFYHFRNSLTTPPRSPSPPRRNDTLIAPSYRCWEDTCCVFSIFPIHSNDIRTRDNSSNEWRNMIIELQSFHAIAHSLSLSKKKNIAMTWRRWSNFSTSPRPIPHSRLIFLHISTPVERDEARAMINKNFCVYVVNYRRRILLIMQKWNWVLWADDSVQLSHDRLNSVNTNQYETLSNWELQFPTQQFLDFLISAGWLWDSISVAK